MNLKFFLAVGKGERDTAPGKTFVIARRKDGTKVIANSCNDGCPTCALARLRTRSGYGSLEFFAPLFVSRQKGEITIWKERTKQPY